MEHSEDILSVILNAPNAPTVAQVANAEQTSAQGSRLPMQQVNARMRVSLQPTVIAAGASQTVAFDNAEPELVTVLAAASPILTISAGTIGNTLASIGQPTARLTYKRGDTITVTNPTASNVTVTIITHDPAFTLEV